jgi:hypothetical protein
LYDYKLSAVSGICFNQGIFLIDLKGITRAGQASGLLAVLADFEKS